MNNTGFLVKLAFNSNLIMYINIAFFLISVRVFDNERVKNLVETTFFHKQIMIWIIKTIHVHRKYYLKFWRWQGTDTLPCCHASLLPRNETCDLRDLSESHRKPSVPAKGPGYLRYPWLLGRSRISALRQQHRYPSDSGTALVDGDLKIRSIKNE